MGVNIEPLDALGVLVTAGEDAVACLALLFVVEDELVLLDGVLWVELNRQVRNQDVLLCDLEVVDHPAVRNWHIIAAKELSVLVHDCALDERLTNGIAENEELTSLFVDFGVGSAGLSQLAVEVVVAFLLDVDFLFCALNLELKWNISLEQSVETLTMQNKGCVGSRPSELWTTH